MSSTCTSGRQGVPSLLIKTSPVVYAKPTRLFTTRSLRSFGETPYAVAFRRNVGLKLSSASRETSSSTRILDAPYGVTGLKVASSFNISFPSDTPYKLQEEEN